MPVDPPEDPGPHTVDRSDAAGRDDSHRLGVGGNRRTRETVTGQVPPEGEAQTPPPAAGPTNVAKAPDDYLQGEARTLLGVLAGFEQAGHAGQLVERDGSVACLTCGTLTDPAVFPVDRVERLEGASDPADMLMVLGGRCPSCGTLGTLTLNFGPTADAGEDRLLERLVLPPG